MTWEPVDRAFGFLLHDVSRLLRKRFDERARALDLTRSQWRVLAHLARHEGIHQAGLAEILEIEPITLARLLDRLERAGWAERRPDPKDKRARRVHLTERTAPLLDQMREVAAAVREDAMAGMAEAERERLMDALLTVKANLQALDDNGRKRTTRRQGNGKAATAAGHEADA